MAIRMRIYGAPGPSPARGVSSNEVRIAQVPAVSLHVEDPFIGIVFQDLKTVQQERLARAGKPGPAHDRVQCRSDDRHGFLRCGTRRYERKARRRGRASDFTQAADSAGAMSGDQRERHGIDRTYVRPSRQQGVQGRGMAARLDDGGKERTAAREGGGERPEGGIARLGILLLQAARQPRRSSSEPGPPGLATTMLQ